MCGIVGILDLTREVQPSLSGVLDSMSHRGPDGRGEYSNRGIGLGHVRLSIIDLSEKASQPMKYRHHDRRFVVTFNGEIYNYLELRESLIRLGHRFSTTSDTEVVLAAYAEWGRGCLEKFNGMFAFAIYCENDGSLFIARDRLGVKPLFYAFDGNRLVFASEIKAFRAMGVELRIREEQFWRYILIPEYHYFGSGSSFFEGIESLPPGNSLHLVHGDLEIRPWWSTRNFRIDTSSESGPMSTAIGTLLKDAVRLRLRSDVAVGLGLSGGMDSTAILAAIAACEPGRRLHTFTICHPGSPRDERGLVEMTVKSFEGKLDIVPIFENFPLEIDAREVIDFCRAHDEPLRSFDVYNQYLLMKLVGSEDIKVLLSGQGSDELFWGYPRYYTRLGVSSLFRLDYAGLLESWKYSRSHYGISWGKYVKNILSTAFPKGFRSKQYRLISKMAIGRLPSKSSYLNWVSAMAPRNLGEYKQVELSESHLPSLLRDEDRNSMRFGVETRSPFLDYRLVEKALTLPYGLNLSGGYTKRLLREAFKADLPEDITRRKSKSGLYEKNTINYVKRFDAIAMDAINSSRFLQERIRLENVPIHDKNVLWRLFNVAALDSI